MKLSRFIRGSSSLALLASLGAAQTPTIDVKDGDSVGFAALTGLNAKSVNDSGDWISMMRTDFPDPTRDSALVRQDGSTYLRDGDVVGGRPIVSLVWHELLSSGHVVTLFADLANTVRGTTVLFDDVVIADLQMQAHGEPPGVNYSNTWTIRASDGTVLLRTRFGLDDCVQILSVDSRGEVFDELTPLIVGGALAGSPDPILALAEAHNAFDVNARGQWITVVSTGVETTGWFDAGTGHVVVDGTIVASEGDAAPVPGRTYSKIFPGSEVALNDLGDHAFTATLSGPQATDFLLVVNGVKYVQDGDVLPDLAPHALSVASGAPLVLTNSRSVFWLASTTDPDASRDQAFMRNRDVIVQEGVTQVGGQTVVQVSAAADAFAASPDGRFWIGEVVLAGGVDAQIAFDFGAAVPIDGCQPNAGKLAVVSGLVLAGQTVTLQLDGEPAAGTLGFLTLSLGRAGDPCGVTLPFGELLIDAGQIIDSIPAGVSGGAPLHVPLAIPNTLALVDVVGYAQGLFLDVAGTLPGPDLTLTNALRLEIGAP